MLEIISNKLHMNWPKRLYKRLILRKWTCEIIWRVIRKRTVYPFHDVPYTVLRFVKLAFYCVLTDPDTKLHKSAQIIEETGTVIIQLINEELNIRRSRIKLKI